MNRNKKRPAYTVRENFAYAIKNMWRCSKGLCAIVFFRPPFVVLASFGSIFLSRQVVNGVTAKQTAGELIAMILMISVSLGLISCIAKYFDTQISRFMMSHDFFYQKLIFIKCLDSDYENAESSKGLSRMAKAKENTGYENSSMRVFVNVLSEVLSNLIGILFYGLLIFRINPAILIVLTITTVSCFFLMKGPMLWVYRNKDKWKEDDRKLEYLQRNSKDFTRAKDMRLYHMQKWFKELFRMTLGRRMKWFGKECAINAGTDAAQDILGMIREGFAYGSLIVFIVSGSFQAADFVLYFGMVGGYADFLFGISRNIADLYKAYLGISEFREFYEYPDRARKEGGTATPKETFSIEFRQVSYRFPGMEKDTIKNLSFTIKKGEKMAIVGPNGAGKTTLVKLICGLYEPTSGEIYIDGVLLNQYNREEYYSLFAAVFQDIFVLPMSIMDNVLAGKGQNTTAENLVLSEKTSPAEDKVMVEQKVREVLEIAGLLPKIDRMPEGIHTRLVKSVFDDAVDLSGGEIQKLALARALYKGGKALILDEPTAALDPIAESSIYEQYNRMTKGHTSVFISHRLASTRFCDRILLLEQGEITESGTHDQLMEQKGKYYEMFEIQSYYYRDEVTVNGI